MQINSLKLLNFRNYESLDIKFSNHLNIIYGNNGMGKTNLIEAIYILGLTKTFRASSESIVIKKGKNIAKIEGIIKDNITNNCKVIISESWKKIKVDNNLILKISDYITKINIILFSPDDLKIIKDTPMIRRRLLNMEISNINKNYIVLLNDYNKLLKQRNAYLKAVAKKNIYQSNFMDVLTEQLIDIGLKIVKIREEFVNNINCYINDIYFKITNEGPLSINFKSEFKNKSKVQLTEMYKKNISREILLGKTLFGPQHDDIEFIIKNEKVKEFSSHGEQKNSVLAFKFAEIINIVKELDKKPIVILDDLFSELDQEKINNILNLLDERLQVFITTTEIEKISKELRDRAKIMKCVNGKIMEE